MCDGKWEERVLIGGRCNCEVEGLNISIVTVDHQSISKQFMYPTLFCGAGRDDLICRRRANLGPRGFDLKPVLNGFPQRFAQFCCLQRNFRGDASSTGTNHKTIRPIFCS